MSSPEASGASVRSQLVKILSSSGFVKNERLSRLLWHIVERQLDGRSAELKESLIGIEVFGRQPGYDPRQDSVVRTEAARLRLRLLAYYKGEGASDVVIIELPKGGYIPTIRQVETAPARRSLWRHGLAAAFGGVVVGIAVLGWWQLHRNAPISIAVMPLNNLSKDAADDYFADGLTDEIIRNLSIIEGLAVRSQTSSFALKGQPRNVGDVGRQLAVDYLLEGSVLRAGSQLRVDVQLVRIKDDFTLWSGRFDRDLTDVFAIQDEISRSIANNLRLNLGRGRRRYETSVEAYDLYLRANALALRRGIRGRVQSIGPLERVIATDPSFAPAYASLGAAYAIRSIQFPVDHPSDELSKMQAAAERAIQLDPLLPDAHEARALVQARNGEGLQAESSFRYAVELDPNRSRTRADFALWLLCVLGRNQEAIQELRIAERADPLSPEIQADLAVVLISAGRFDEASEHCSKMSADDPMRGRCLGRAQIGKGKIADAIAFLAGDATPDPESRGFAGYLKAQSGHRDEAEKLAAATEYPNERALIFAGLGDRNRTFQALDLMASLGPQRVGMYLNYPELALLRGDLRLRALRKKVGLPD